MHGRIHHVWSSSRVALTVVPGQYHPGNLVADHVPITVGDDDLLNGRGGFLQDGEVSPDVLVFQGSFAVISARRQIRWAIDMIARSGLDSRPVRQIAHPRPVQEGSSE